MPEKTTPLSNMKKRRFSATGLVADVEILDVSVGRGAFVEADIASGGAPGLGSLAKTTNCE